MSRAHKHVCRSRFHEGKRERTCYGEMCTSPRVEDCWPCHDDELAAQGATWETGGGDGPSDADPGL